MLPAEGSSVSLNLRVQCVAIYISQKGRAKPDMFQLQMQRTGRSHNPSCCGLSRKTNILFKTFSYSGYNYQGNCFGKYHVGLRRQNSIKELK